MDSEEMVEPDATFKRPNYFNNRLSEVKRRIASLSVKTPSYPAVYSPGISGQSAQQPSFGSIMS